MLILSLFLLLLVYILILRPWFLRWGATAEEAAMPLPGDEIAPVYKLSATRAITIHAPASQIWPWLVQMGQGRGGLYSYLWIENMIGCKMHNADHIIPELQNPQIGDLIRMGPEGYPLFKITAIQPQAALVIQGLDPRTKEPGQAYWSFVLQPVDAQTTRLIIRGRNDYEPSLFNFLMWRVIVEPGYFVMEQKMLRGIRERAERIYTQARVAA
ncbi:MAG: hypothetical protein K8L99_08950 [Anaerolineae bacterium]|nr:hypothetical protein [Anaerolineae bacterium]